MRALLGSEYTAPGTHSESKYAEPPTLDPKGLGGGGGSVAAL